MLYSPVGLRIPPAPAHDLKMAAILQQLPYACDLSDVLELRVVEGEEIQLELYTTGCFYIVMGQEAIQKLQHQNVFLQWHQAMEGPLEVLLPEMIAYHLGLDQGHWGVSQIAYHLGADYGHSEVSQEWHNRYVWQAKQMLPFLGWAEEREVHWPELSDVLRRWGHFQQTCQKARVKLINHKQDSKDDRVFLDFSWVGWTFAQTNLADAVAQEQVINHAFEEQVINYAFEEQHPGKIMSLTASPRANWEAVMRAFAAYYQSFWQMLESLEEPPPNYGKP